MAELLSDSDWQEFQDAIQDVTDTFMKHSIVYHKITTKYSTWQENKENNSDTQDFNLLALSVYAKTGSGGKDKRLAIGSQDLTEGYLLFNWWDLEAKGLINPIDKTPLFNTNLDEATFFGNRYMLTGTEQVGPFREQFALVKVHFKRTIKKA